MFTAGQFARCPALNEPPGNVINICNFESETVERSTTILKIWTSWVKGSKVESIVDSGVGIVLLKVNFTLEL